MRQWSALVVPPSLDERTLARFTALDVGPLAIARWGSGGVGPLGVLVTPEPFGTTALERMLDLLVDLNVDWLREHPDGPPLYQSGARYRYEVPDRPEQWLSIPWLLLSAVRPDVLADCKGLCAARVAELRRQGERRARCVWSVSRSHDRPVVHIRVRRADGSREDPSALLGMGRHLGGVTC